MFISLDTYLVGWKATPFAREDLDSNYSSVSNCSVCVGVIPQETSILRAVAAGECPTSIVTCRVDILVDQRSDPTTTGGNVWNRTLGKLRKDTYLREHLHFGPISAQWRVLQGSTGGKCLLKLCKRGKLACRCVRVFRTFRLVRGGFANSHDYWHAR